jgi:hypothetical protein
MSWERTQKTTSMNRTARTIVNQAIPDVGCALIVGWHSVRVDPSGYIRIRVAKPC